MRAIQRNNIYILILCSLCMVWYVPTAHRSLKDKTDSDNSLALSSTLYIITGLYTESW